MDEERILYCFPSLAKKVVISSFSFKKVPISAQLYRIGLKWRNEQWALAGPGLFANELVTIRKAKIWDNRGYYLIVPAGTIIGSFVMAKNGLTQFRTIDNRNLFVETTALKYRHD